jgi:hypothetical protein
MYSETHSIEPELERPVPRRIRRRHGHGTLINCVHIFILPHTVIGICALGYAILMSLMPIVGVTTTGHVTAVREHYGSKSGQTYTAQYAYEYNGQQYTSFAKIDYDQYRTWQVGRPVQVTVMPPTPGIGAHLVESPGAVGGTIAFLWVWVCFWNSIMFAFWWTMLIRPLINRALVVNGTPCSGTVVEKRMIQGKSITYSIRYNFQPESFGTRQADVITGAMTARGVDWETAHEGRPVTVLHNPRNPRWNIAYPFADYEAV